jgi:hypothetical protein
VHEHINENKLIDGVDLISLTIYSVTFNTSDSSDEIYYGVDGKRAKLEYDYTPDISEKLLGRNDMSMKFEKQTNQYKFIYDSDFESIEDYPIEDYYNDSDIYELVDEGEWELIDYRKIDAANSKSDELLQDVQHYYGQKYGNYKYNTIHVYDEDDEYKGCIELRIANHTENIHNVDRYGECDYHISIVIANHDATKKRFGMSNTFERKSNEVELVFDEDDKFYDVIEKIDNLIEKFKLKIIY